MQIADLLPPQGYDFDPVLEFDAGIEQAARALDVEPWILQRVKHPEREITLNLPAVQDDGTAMNVTGYRVQHSRAHGPCIGPAVLSMTAHPAQLRNQATMITLQSALLELPLGGSAGAIVCDTARIGEAELRRVIQTYVSALRNDTGALVDVIVAHGPRWMMNEMADAARRARGHCEPAAVITDDMVVTPTIEAIIALVRRALGGWKSTELRVAIQGYGRRARTLAEVLYHEGARIVAVADRSGGVIRRDGFDAAALSAYVADRGVVFGFPNAEPASNAAVLEYDCDLLALAAAERQVGAHNAEHIRARAIVELTPHAVAVAAQQLPHCTYIPSLLCGSAEVAVWFYLWQRGLTYSLCDRSEAAQFATDRVLSVFDQVQKAEGTSLLDRTRLTAVARLAQLVRR